MTTETTGSTEGQAQTTATNEQTATTQAPVVDTTIGDSTTPAPSSNATVDPAPEAAVTYDPTGDPGLDVALNFVGGLGIKADHPAMVATATGDFGLIKAHLATMGDKARGWEQMVALAEDSFKRQEAAKVETAKQVSAVVVSVAGSAENWNTIKDWAAKNATPDERKMLNGMFAAGPMQARGAAMMMLDAYNKASGTVVKPKSATTQTATGEAAQTSGPLGKREYAAAVRALHAKLGSRMEGSGEYAALRQRFSK